MNSSTSSFYTRLLRRSLRRMAQGTVATSATDGSTSPNPTTTFASPFRILLALTLTLLGVQVFAPMPASAAAPCHPGTYQSAVFPVGTTYTVTFNGTFNSYSGTINWGDGSTTSASGSGSWSHTYNSVGDFDFKITGSGSYGDPATPCSDNISAEVGARVWSRLGIVTAAQTEGAKPRDTLVHVPIYLHPGSSSLPVTVSWRTVDGTAKAGTDYIAKSGTLTFSPGTVSQEVVIAIVGDDIAEGNEGFNVKITGADNAFIDTTYQYSLIAIRDDDSAARCPGAEAQRGNHIVGTPKADTLRGTPRRDVICGLGRNDKLIGLGGNDVLLGGPGADHLTGGPGADHLNGGPGTDTCVGGPGPDTAVSCER
jgi:Ca2+-binding RTX toxin-like protein